VAHALVKAIDFVLATGEGYLQPKAEMLRDIQRQRVIRHHTRRLRRLGCWLAKEDLTLFQEWYVARCLPALDAPLPSAVDASRKRPAPLREARRSNEH
jgi:hypothetical protein